MMELFASSPKLKLDEDLDHFVVNCPNFKD